MRLLEKYPKFRELMMSASPALVDVNDAVHWYFEESPQDHWDLAEDMHALTPPHGFTYMEFSMPEKINVNGKFLRPDSPRIAVGCLTTCADIVEDFRASAMQEWILERHIASTYGNIPGMPEEMMSNISKNKTWRAARERGISLGIAPSFLLDSTVYLDDPQGVKIVFRCGMYLDENGKAYPGLNGTLVSAGPSESEGDEMEMEHLNWFLPFAFALSLMNCKNVHLIDDQRVLMRNQRRRMERSGNPIIDYKWLHIKQLTKKVNADMEHQKTGRHNRLHFVRAHWATYTADAPLFGKYQGVFFKPSHVKGSLSAGVALKNYTVDAPTNGETKAK